MGRVVRVWDVVKADETWTITGYGRAMGLCGCYGLSIYYCMDCMEEVVEGVRVRAGCEVIAETDEVVYTKCKKCGKIRAFIKR